ncbi:MAG: hypothetical protein BroJett018_02770 [Chloroflexota bacterium]|nr:hypothetical protein [Chloroflexota bacterium]NOG61929.1 hypothetical protein [Chloroflexota bacterium]GIK62483.1 MAG: hypothetical protein BroJett018_02770 [Chloroflexota bacterium]
MTVKNRKRLVIDASVARAAGGTEKLHPDSKLCREFLLEVLKLCHSMILTPEITVEWDKHQSRYVSTWRVNMARRGKIIHRKAEDVLNEDLRQAIEETVTDEAILKIIMKDIRLIEAALAADFTIASCDNRVRQHLMNVAQVLDDLEHIVWINPTIEGEGCVTWLRQGAPAEAKRCLGYRDEL